MLVETPLVLDGLLLFFEKGGGFFFVHGLEALVADFVVDVVLKRQRRLFAVDDVKSRDNLLCFYRAVLYLFFQG